MWLVIVIYICSEKIVYFTSLCRLRFLTSGVLLKRAKLSKYSCGRGTIVNCRPRVTTVVYKVLWDVSEPIIHCRGIFADVNHYILTYEFAHLRHFANYQLTCVQKVKELIKLDNEPIISHQKLTNSWVANP